MVFFCERIDTWIHVHDVFSRYNLLLQMHAWMSYKINQIRRARDKNKRNVNHGRINHFRAALHSCELTEIHLQNRRFTWSNERENPTLRKLDAFDCNSEWDIRFDTHVLGNLVRVMI